jgi:MoxR-like ATPase
MTAETHDTVTRLEANISSVVLGKPAAVRTCLVALLAGEHVLLEDVPGVGKTLVGKALARSVAGKFSRIQFTPDLLPSDILGSSVFNSQTSQFSFQAGPIFANVVLADEINRAPPRTQSALLEAMSDNQVSFDGQTHPLPDPFMVIATQNPYEYEGTYPLPESQLDRFLVRISMGYPDRRNELQVLLSHQLSEPIEELAPVVEAADVLRLQRQVREIRIDASIHEYVLDIVERTRQCEELRVGVSTRGALALARASQAAALLAGRDFVVPDDVKRLAVPVISHRVLAKGMMPGGQRDTTELLIGRLVEEAAVPV